MKKYLYVLMLTIMVVVMSEFQTAGMMPQIAADLGVSTGQVGTVVTLYALGMALGGPLLVYLLRHRPPKASLLIVIGTYAALEVLVPLIHEFWWLALLRVLTGCLSGAAYGIAVAYSARLAPSPEKIGEAVSIVLGGIMIGTVIGLPLSHFLAARWGWQSSFYILGIAAFAVFLISLLTLPAREAATQEAAAQDLRKLRSPKLWSRYLVSLLTIGAAFAGFSYFTPLLEQNAGFATNTTTLILLAYGIVSFIGNLIVGKFADQHAIGILRIGHTLLFISLALLGAFSNAQPLVLAMVLIVGVAGVPMNPAMVARVAEIGGTGNMVSTVHTSVITMGVALGSAIGALAIGRAGDDPSAAMWIGASFAVLATLTLATQARGRRQHLRPPHATETVDCV